MPATDGRIMNRPRQTQIAAARAGKHVLVEKPMAMSAAECRHMIDACETHGVQLMVCYYQRFNARHQKMRELLKAGAIGRVVSATACNHPDPGGYRHRYSGRSEVGGRYARLAHLAGANPCTPRRPAACRLSSHPRRRPTRPATRSWTLPPTCTSPAAKPPSIWPAIGWRSRRAR